MLKYDLYDNTILEVCFGESFSSFADIVKDNNVLPEYLNMDVPYDYQFLMSDDDIEIAYYMNLRKEFDIWDEQFSDDPFNAYILDISNNFGQNVISIRVDCDWIIPGYESEMGECLYQCLRCIIYDDHTYNYVQGKISIWEPGPVFSFMIMSLSGNYMENSPGFTWLYDQIMSSAPAGWDVIFTHYNEDDKKFPYKGVRFDIESFIEMIRYDGDWNEANNIWLWACDAGISKGQDPYIAAADMSQLTGVNVKAPLGRIFVAPSVYHTEECPHYAYSIVNVHGTKWNDIDDYSNMEGKGKIKLIKYLNKNNLVNTGRAWAIFTPEGDVYYDE